MCLAVPMKVIDIDGNMVSAELGGTKKEGRLDVIDEMPQIGDYVIIHAGFALHRIDPGEAKKMFEMWKEIGWIDEIPE